MIEKLFNKIKTSNAAYIFTGMEGVGKMYNALYLAKASICGTFPPCGVCSSCLRIHKNTHPNLIIIEPDGKDIKIEQIRATIKDLNFTPIEDRKRFIIINKAHRMNNTSSNALLKTLEQPPKNTIFILCTSTLNTLLPTIVSRCELVKFPPLKEDKIAKILNLKTDNVLLKYSLGSIKKTSFYIEFEEEFLALIKFLDSKTHTYKELSLIVSKLLEKTGSDISSAEQIFSFIINYLNLKMKTYIENGTDISDILEAVQKINEQTKKIYYNTPVNHVAEAVLIEATKRL